MKDKKCSKCKEEKPYLEFGKNKSKKDGYCTECKKCVKITGSKYYNSNKEQLKEKHKEYWKGYSKKNRIELNKVNKLYEDKNKDKRKIRDKSYYKENKKSIQARHKIYSKTYEKNRAKKDALFKFKQNIRTLIRHSFKSIGIKKNNKTVQILGCSFQEFKEHIEKQFEPWMNWTNHGKYNGTLNYGFDLDHIIPIASAKTKEDIIKLNHYTNFQPLCSYTNRYIKRDNI